MKKWSLTACIYLAVVVGVYYGFFAEKTDETMHHSDTQQTDSTEDIAHHEESHSEHGQTNTVTEISPKIHEENGELVITLKDEQGNNVTDLEVNHEKLMHLIVVSQNLQEFYHLHPVLNDKGEFITPHTLPDGEYKIFVDVKPKNLNYVVRPIEFIIGNPTENHEHVFLQTDSLTKQIDSHTVTLQTTSFHVNVEIQLRFDLHGEIPEPHLGALGHVVILDEQAEHYLHVHPLPGDEPIFETSFHSPGIYKIWAEFKINEEVIVFPYVVKVD